MNIQDNRIDGGKAFDWGRVSEAYARYRDIYPALFFKKIIDRGLCIKGQTVLDIGTGTGVLPRNLYMYEAQWVGIDISAEQIRQAKRLSAEGGMNIAYHVLPTEQLTFPAESFDVITACQCFWYFDHAKVAPLLANMLKRNGRLLILYMAWLPFEDEIAGASEELVLKYSPNWSGSRETMKPIDIPPILFQYFDSIFHEEYKLTVPFTKETWHGRMKACRGIGASLNARELADWEREHRELLDRIAPDEFEVLHYAALAELKVKSH